MIKKLSLGDIFLMAVLLTANLIFCSTIFADELNAIQLSKPQFDRGKLLMETLNCRKTTRAFSSKQLPVDVLSNLLWAACGINRPDVGKRTAPSAVNWQEIDIYVAMEGGLYRYNPVQYMLEPVMAKDIRSFTGKQNFTQSAPINLIYVADFSKMNGDTETKIFYSAVDTGFISQNVYLFCASEGLATVVLGMVDKPALEKVMNLKNEQKVILTQPVGYPQ